MTLRVGAIVRWHTQWTQPPKRKRFLCVDAGRNWFLMLNSRDLWGPSVALPAADAGGGLDHDSFAELATVLAAPPTLAAMLADGSAEVRGHVGRATLRRLLAAVNKADTLPDGQRTVILAAIEAALAGTDGAG